MPMLSMGLEILTSRACELTTIRELDEDLSERDKDFTSKRFLVNLAKVKEIEPLPKTLCSESEEVIEIGGDAVEGVPGFGRLNLYQNPCVQNQKKL